MKTKEKKIIDIQLDDIVARSDRRINRLLTMLLAVLVAVALIISTICGFVHMHRKQRALLAVSNEQTAKIASLEQQLSAQQSELDALKSQNGTLQSQNEALADENEAFKAQIGKYGLQYPAEAYAGKKLVAITFDDGPGQYTAELLDFLKENEVRATFFMLGTNASRYPDLIKRMDAEGHALGNHSNSHPNLTTLSTAGVASQLEKCNAAIRSAVGRNAAVMRCPGGSNNATVKNAAKNANMPIIHWSLDTLDWKLKDKDKILKRTFEEIGVKDGDIILLHDIHRESVDAAKDMILRLKKEGYTFVTVPELLSVRKGGMNAGQVYTNAPPVA